MYENDFLDSMFVQSLYIIS